MDIIVHGTKGGRKIFTPKKLSGLLNVMSDTSRAATIGQQAYAIRFTDKNTIFSKYKIIRDVRSDKQTGFVAFSTFVPYNEKLSGTDIITLLDKVSYEYCMKYIIDNNLNDVIEDWSFLDRISREYELNIQIVTENSGILLSGLKDDAFIYYNDENKLQEYFDKPFQEEYSDFRQILFVKKELLYKVENPLNTFRHSDHDLTSIIYFQNEYYYLNNYDHSKGVVIIADGKPCGYDKNNNCIRARWQVEIKYSKDERYYFPIEVKGTLSNPDSEIYKYLEIDNNQIIIKYDAFDNSLPKTKTIIFFIKDSKGNPVNNAEIQIGDDPLKIISGYQTEITFKGEDIGKYCNVSAKKGSDNLCSKLINVFPENQNDIITLILYETKIIEIFVVNEDGNNISDFDFWINDGNGIRKDVKYLCFLEDDINKTWKIKISKKEGQDYYSRTVYYRYATGDNPLYVQLKKTTEQRTYAKMYRIDAGEHGKKTIAHSYRGDGSDLGDNPIKPNKGWKFTGFELINIKTGIYDGTLTAQYKRKKLFFNKSLIIISVIIGIIGISLGIWMSNYYFKTDKSNQIFSKKIEDTINKITQEQSSANDDLSNSSNEEHSEQEMNDSSSTLSNPTIPTNPQISDITTEIIIYIKGNELDKEKLKEYKELEEISKDLKKSIQLCLDFWELNGSGRNTYWVLRRKVQEDIMLKKSKLKVFLDEMCSEGADMMPYYSDSYKKNGLFKL